MLAECSGERVLLLQGPMGPFFARLAQDLRRHGAKVFKINFNAGDQLFYQGRGAHAYKGTMEDWPAWLKHFIEEHSITAVALFGDMRPIHRAVVPMLEAQGLSVYVFEEGYLRPDHVTCELGGVNGNSSMPSSPDFYRDKGLRPREDVEPVGHTFVFAALYSILYSLAFTFGSSVFPNYRHHRDLNAGRQAVIWALAGLRKVWFRWRERDLLERLTGPLSGRFFLVPLQVHCDAQLLHSEYETIDDFIVQTIKSFAEHAPEATHLVLKHHPADRGYRDYKRLVQTSARNNGLSGRVHYIHDQHLPTLLRHARGTVTINSTVGISSIHHGCPTQVMGTAIYDIETLTHTGGLDSFWHAPSEPDLELYVNFRGWLENYNQVNGSIWKVVTKTPSGTGLKWPRPLQSDESTRGRNPDDR